MSAPRPPYVFACLAAFAGLPARFQVSQQDDNSVRIANLSGQPRKVRALMVW